MAEREFGQVDRRSFLATGAAVAAGAGLLGAAEELEAAALPTRTLGKTGLKVTTISFGAMFLSTMDHARILDAAIDRGMNLVHVSPNYTNGQAIKVVGEVMKRKRSKVYIALKVDPNDRRMDEYLRTLNTDHVDILVPPKTSVGDFSNDATRQGFARLKQAGKIRFSGWADHSIMAQSLKAAADAGWWDVVLLKYNINCRRELDPAVADAVRRAKIGILVMKGTEGLQRGNATQFQAGLRGLLTNTNLTSLCLGTAALDQVATNANAVLQRNAWADREFAEYAAGCAGRNCNSCGACQEACPQGLAVNEYLRAWSYRDRGDVTLATDLVRALPARRSLAACTNCSACNRACPREIDVLQRMADAAG
ncbi:MAG: aldo/keto reductase [Fimbriimonadaceae bacterium]|nr:aldo/keto reductase [Fimbriimonadaceae bacterium]